MEKPIIGITVEVRHDEKEDRTGGRLVCNQNYTEEVTRAGGVPLLIPPSADMDAVAQLIDGWLIPGGNDIDARHFGEENHPEVELGDDARFLSEERLFKAIARDLPILGICYGCQFLNVIHGGTLVQHLPDVLGHNEHAKGPLQNYEIAQNSKLKELVGVGAVEGRSYHHQATGRVGENLSVVARAEDGTIEALENGTRPWLVGVQWHPERTPDDAATQRLFAGFIDAARSYRSKRGK